MLIRLVGVWFTDLIPGNYQIDLFDVKQEHIKQYQSIDSLKVRFGEKLVGRAGEIVRWKRKSKGLVHV